jgi:hypothetical protein
MILRTNILAEKSRVYLPSYKRVESPPPMRLTARDKQIVLAIYEYRILSSQQIEALLFQSEKQHGKQTVCQRRLQLLYQHNFLERLLLPIVLGEGRAPFVYVLAEAGANLVASLLGIDRAKVGWKPKADRWGPLFIEHSLAVNTVRVAFHCLPQARSWTIGQWIGEAEFRTRTMQEKVPKRTQGGRTTRNYPDGYFTLVRPNTKEAHFFLEVDQATMSNSRWQEKIKAYSEFRARGLSQKHYGTQNFRVLTVTTTERQMQKLKQATEKVKGDDYFWFTTQDDIDLWNPHKLLEPIWSVATQDTKRQLVRVSE